MAKSTNPYKDENVGVAYEYSKSEINSRSTIQSQVLIAAIAGLGVIISQVADIQSKKLYEIYLGASFLYAMIGLQYLDNDRIIAKLGRY